MINLLRVVYPTVLSTFVINKYNGQGFSILTGTLFKLTVVSRVLLDY